MKLNFIFNKLTWDSLGIGQLAVRLCFKNGAGTGIELKAGKWFVKKTWNMGICYDVVDVQMQLFPVRIIKKEALGGKGGEP